MDDDSDFADVPRPGHVLLIVAAGLIGWLALACGIAWAVVR